MDPGCPACWPPGRPGLVVSPEVASGRSSLTANRPQPGHADPANGPAQLGRAGPAAGRPGRPVTGGWPSAAGESSRGRPSIPGRLAAWSMLCAASDLLRLGVSSGGARPEPAPGRARTVNPYGCSTGTLVACGSARPACGATFEPPPLRGDVVTDDPRRLRSKLFAQRSSTVLGEVIRLLERWFDCRLQSGWQCRAAWSGPVRPTRTPRPCIMTPSRSRPPPPCGWPMTAWPTVDMSPNPMEDCVSGARIVRQPARRGLPAALGGRGLVRRGWPARPRRPQSRAEEALTAALAAAISSTGSAGTSPPPATWSTGGSSGRPTASIWSGPRSSRWRGAATPPSCRWPTAASS